MYFEIYGIFVLRIFVNKDNSNFKEMKFDIDGYLRKLFDSREMPLYHMMAYHMGFQDKAGNAVSASNSSYLHALSSMAIGEIFNAQKKFIYPISSAIEMFLNFTEIHDDVKDGLPQRNGKDTVWWIWGPAQGINAGDGLHSLARLQICELSQIGVTSDVVFEALQMFDSASLKFSESKYLELEFQERIDVKIEEYMELLYLRAEFLSVAMKLAALVSDSGNQLKEEIGKFGFNLGVLLQINKDIDSFWESPEVDLNFLNKKKTLPIVYAFKYASNSQKIRLGDIYFKRVLTNEDITQLKTILDEIDVRKFCEQDRKKLTHQLNSSIDLVCDNQRNIDSVKNLVDYLMLAGF